jgi:hypothetical protein
MRVLVEFASAADARRALTLLTSSGYRRPETYGPFPLTDDDAHAPRGSVVLSVLAFAGALAGLVAAYLIQWYANVRAYPLNEGGRPVHAAAAFVPATVETICLCATAALFVGFLVVERLPRLWQPIFEIDGFERTGIDRFWLGVHAVDLSSAERVVEAIAAAHPLRAVVAEETR